MALAGTAGAEDRDHPVLYLADFGVKLVPAVRTRWHQAPGLVAIRTGPGEVQETPLARQQTLAVGVQAARPSTAIGVPNVGAGNRGALDADPPIGEETIAVVTENVEGVEDYSSLAVPNND